MRLRHGMGLVVFCLLAGSRWLVDAAWPSTLPLLLGRSLQLAAAGMVALIVSLIQRRVYRRGKQPLWQIGCAGVLLFGVPVATQVAGPSIQPETSVAMYAMVPLCIVLMAARTAGDTGRALMMPALAGLAGALLILPWRLPTGGGWAAFALVFAGVPATAVGSVWLWNLIRGTALVRSTAVISLSTAAVLGLGGILRGERMTGFGRGDAAAVLVAIPLLFSLLWLVGEVAPERLASRFFLVPLMTIAEGAVMIRPPLDVQMGAGFLLLLVGGGWLLFGGRDGDVSLSIRSG